MIDLLSDNSRIKQTSIYFTFMRQVVQRIDIAFDLADSANYLGMYLLGLITVCAAVVYTLKS